MGSMIFKPAARYPADPRAVFVLALSVFTGLTALVLSAGPDSLEAVMPRWAVLAWGLLLATGSLVALIGMAYQSVNGIIAEQIGSVMVGATTVFYSIVALRTVGPEAVQTIGIILAWGIACFLRWGQLQVLIHSSIQRARKREVLDRIFAEIDEHEGRHAGDRARRRMGHER